VSVGGRGLGRRLSATIASSSPCDSSSNAADDDGCVSTAARLLSCRVLVNGD